MFTNAKAFAFAAALMAVTTVQAYSGDATYYYPELGACGRNNGAGELVAAVAAPVFDRAFPGAGGNPNNNNPICGRQARVNGNGRSVAVTIVDRCPGCGSQGIDLSPAAFQQLAGLDVGRIHVDWSL